MTQDLFEQLAGRRASRRASLIGSGDPSRLRWLVNLADPATLDKMPGREFERLRLQVEAFVELAGSSSQDRRKPLSRTAIKRMAEYVRKVLRAHTGGATWDLPPMRVSRSIIPGSDTAVYHGPWRDVFLMAVGDLLQSVGGLLRVCSAADCDRPFVRNKRKIYCSARCSARERMRRFQADRERYKAKRRKYYRRSLQRQGSFLKT